MDACTPCSTAHSGLASTPARSSVVAASTATNATKQPHLRRLVPRVIAPRPSPAAVVTPVQPPAPASKVTAASSVAAQRQTQTKQAPQVQMQPQMQTQQLQPTPPQLQFSTPVAINGGQLQPQLRLPVGIPAGQHQVLLSHHQSLPTCLAFSAGPPGHFLATAPAPRLPTAPATIWAPRKPLGGNAAEIKRHQQQQQQQLIQAQQHFLIQQQQLFMQQQQLVAASMSLNTSSFQVHEPQMSGTLTHSRSESHAMASAGAGTRDLLMLACQEAGIEFSLNEAEPRRLDTRLCTVVPQVTVTSTPSTVLLPPVQVPAAANAADEADGGSSFLQELGLLDYLPDIDGTPHTLLQPSQESTVSLEQQQHQSETGTFKDALSVCLLDKLPPTPASTCSSHPPQEAHNNASTLAVQVWPDVADSSQSLLDEMLFSPSPLPLMPVAASASSANDSEPLAAIIGDGNVAMFNGDVSLNLDLLSAIATVSAQRPAVKNEVVDKVLKQLALSPSISTDMLQENSGMPPSFPLNNGVKLELNNDDLYTNAELSSQASKVEMSSSAISASPGPRNTKFALNQSVEVGVTPPMPNADGLSRNQSYADDKRQDAVHLTKACDSLTNSLSAQITTISRKEQTTPSPELLPVQTDSNNEELSTARLPSLPTQSTEVPFATAKLPPPVPTLKCKELTIKSTKLLAPSESRREHMPSMRPVVEKVIKCDALVKRETVDLPARNGYVLPNKESTGAAVSSQLSNKTLFHLDLQKSYTLPSSSSTLTPLATTKMLNNLVSNTTFKTEAFSHQDLAPLLATAPVTSKVSQLQSLRTDSKGDESTHAPVSSDKLNQKDSSNLFVILALDSKLEVSLHEKRKTVILEANNFASSLQPAVEQNEDQIQQTKAQISKLAFVETRKESLLSLLTAKERACDEIGSNRPLQEKSSEKSIDFFLNASSAAHSSCSSDSTILSQNSSKESSSRIEDISSESHSVSTSSSSQKPSSTFMLQPVKDAKFKKKLAIAPEVLQVSPTPRTDQAIIPGLNQPVAVTDFPKAKVALDEPKLEDLGNRIDATISNVINAFGLNTNTDCATSSDCSPSSAKRDVLVQVGKQQKPVQKLNAQRKQRQAKQKHETISDTGIFTFTDDTLTAETANVVLRASTASTPKLPSLKITIRKPILTEPLPASLDGGGLKLRFNLKSLGLLSFASSESAHSGDRQQQSYDSGASPTSSSASTNSPPRCCSNDSVTAAPTPPLPAPSSQHIRKRHREKREHHELTVDYAAHRQLSVAADPNCVVSAQPPPKIGKLTLRLSELPLHLPAS